MARRAATAWRSSPARSQLNPTGVESRTIVLFDHSDDAGRRAPLRQRLHRRRRGRRPDLRPARQRHDPGRRLDRPRRRRLTSSAARRIGARRRRSGWTRRAVSCRRSSRRRDGDDYIEGNGGNDVIFGNLGQDDIVGGSSTLFGLAAPRRCGRTAPTSSSAAPAPRDDSRPSTATATRRDGHARDADAIAGDNAQHLPPGRRERRANGVAGTGVQFNGFLQLRPYDDTAYDCGDAEDHPARGRSCSTTRRAARTSTPAAALRHRRRRRDPRRVRRRRRSTAWRATTCCSAKARTTT